MSDEIVIVGGGFAGLAAGVALAEAGRRVRLLEQNPYLGGRARSFCDPKTGSVVDNGQHLVMGCYRAMIRFLSTIGTLDKIKFQPRLRVPFLERGGRLTWLDCPRLPSPWHLLVGVLRSRSFSAGQKLEIARFGNALLNGNKNGASPALESVTAWLTRSGQSDRLQKNFWDLLCIAAMNEDPDVASARLFERVLKLALFTSPEDSRLGIPSAGLSDCYTNAAATYIQTRGGRVETGRGAKNVLISQGTCHGVELGDGTQMDAEQVILAVPWHRLAAVLPSELIRSEPGFAKALELRPAPIISITLWFDRPITDLEFVGLRGTTIQWLFNKRRITGSNDNLVSLVLSGAHQHVDRSKEELVDVALRDLGELLPMAREAKLTHRLVIKERFATFSPSPDAEALRPPARTSVRGLFLAGDWTATSLPATIEGAVQSGYSAAAGVIRD